MRRLIEGGGKGEFGGFEGLEGFEKDDKDEKRGEEEDAVVSDHGVAKNVGNPW
ncbi:MAG: hypothetical protein HY751_02970 [Nitrospinae bacterium]|nr:hypothetical protein [Nitrospinota bacterium]